jgi:hypothetical protein
MRIWNSDLATEAVFRGPAIYILDDKIQGGIRDYKVKVCDRLCHV